MSVSLSSLTNTGQNDFITRYLLWLQMVKYSIPSSTERFRTYLCGDHSMKAATTAQVNIRDIGWLLPEKSFISLNINTLFPTLKELLYKDMASQITAAMVSSPDLSDLCFMHPITCYWTLLNGLTAHNCHSHMQMWPWELAHCSFVTCAIPYRVVRSRKVMPRHKMQT